jgi:hypothetical protein
MRLYIYLDIYIYLGEELDAVADPDQVHVVVEPEDVHPGPRAAGVEDHGVPPRPTRRIDTALRSRLVVVVAVAVAVAHGEEEARRLPTEHGGVGKDLHAGVRRGPPRQLQGQEEHCCCHRPRCHCYERTRASRLLLLRRRPAMRARTVFLSSPATEPTAARLVCVASCATPCWCWPFKLVAHGGSYTYMGMNDLAHSRLQPCVITYYYRVYIYMIIYCLQNNITIQLAMHETTKDNNINAKKKTHAHGG